MTDPIPKKILLVITKSNWGGAQSYVYELATHLAGAGHDVAVALGGTGDAGAPVGMLADKLAGAGIRTVGVRSLTRDISLWREWTALSELTKLFRHERPAVVHLNSSKVGGIGALAGRLARVPRIVFTAHGWPHVEPRPLFARVLIWIASYATVVLTHATIVLAESQKKLAPAPFFRRRLHVVPNGIAETTLLTKTVARAELAKRVSNVSAYPRLLISIAELHANKGLDVLIRAFARIAHTHSHTALVLIGEGEERGALEKLCASFDLGNQVIFAGFIANANSLLPAADAFVLSSRKEGLPFVLLEAGRASLPVVATHVGAVPDVITDDIDGLLVPPNAPAPLADALDRVLADAALAKRLGDTLHAYVQEHFSLDRTLAETLRVYGI